MPDGLKRKRRYMGNGKYDRKRAEWYAKHRQKRFSKRMGFYS